MNRTLSYGAKVFAHLDPSKGVDASGQQDGGHGSRNPLRSVEAAVRHYAHSRTRTHALKSALGTHACRRTSQACGGSEEGESERQLSER